MKKLTEEHKNHIRQGIRRYMSCARRDKTWEEIYGKEKALKTRQKQRQSVLGKDNPNYRGGKRKVNCDYCDKEFQVKPGSKQKYCSGSCRAKNRIGKNAANWQGGKISLICLNCQELYDRKPCDAHDSKFCSISCKSQYNNQGKKSS